MLPKLQLFFCRVFNKEEPMRAQTIFIAQAHTLRAHVRVPTQTCMCARGHHGAGPTHSPPTSSTSHVTPSCPAPLSGCSHLPPAERALWSPSAYTTRFPSWLPSSGVATTLCMPDDNIDRVRMYRADAGKKWFILCLWFA